jgi:hypothetical protein
LWKKLGDCPRFFIPHATPHVTPHVTQQVTRPILEVR